MINNQQNEAKGGQEMEEIKKDLQEIKKALQAIAISLEQDTCYGNLCGKTVVELGRFQFSTSPTGNICLTRLENLK